MTRIPEQDDVLFETAQKLEAAGIPYMLTGSQALSFYAEPRQTNDIDVVVEASEQHAAAFERIFPRAEKWYLSETAVREAIHGRGMFNAIHTLSGVKVDVILLKNDPLERLKFSRRVRHERAGLTLWIISPEDLLLSKLAWGKRGASARQAADVRTLLRDVAELDWAYVEEWADRIGVRDWLDRARGAGHDA
jgi:hypothetical protein